MNIIGQPGLTEEDDPGKFTGFIILYDYVQPPSRVMICPVR